MKKELIDLCMKGDEQALSVLYNHYSAKMLRICLRYVPDEQTAQDLLHDGFIIAFTTISSLRNPDKLESWLTTIMKNISLQYLNKHNSFKLTSIDDVETCEEPYYTPSYNNFPSYDTMLKAIEQLPKGYSQIFKLSVLEGLSHKEIGERLGIAPHSSSSQLSRAKEMLRKIMSDYRIILLLILILSTISVNKYNFSSQQKTLTQHKNKETITKRKDITVTSKKEKVTAKSGTISHAHNIERDNTSVDDTIQIDSIPTAPKPTIYLSLAIQENVDKTTYENLPKHSKQKWSISLSYSGEKERSNTLYKMIPGNITSEATESKEETHHYMPITVSLTFHKKINKQWGIESGLQYNYLRSDFIYTNDLYTEHIQKIHYLGIPLKTSFCIWSNNKFSVYTSAGITLDIPIKAQIDESILDKGEILHTSSQTLHPGIQWSIHTNVGVQYQLAPSIGIYAEPQAGYYFNNSKSLNTIRKEHPLTISLPIGIRFSW